MVATRYKTAFQLYPYEKVAAQDIILAPVITENSMTGMQNKKYTFKVATGATKIDIARACEELFGVKVAP